MPGWYTVAKWELIRSGMKFSRRSIVAVLLTLLLLSGVSYAVSLTGMNLDQKIYSVVTSSSELSNIIYNDGRFDVLPADSKDADITIVDDRAYISGTKKINCSCRCIGKGIHQLQRNCPFIIQRYQ